MGEEDGTLVNFKVKYENMNEQVDIDLVDPLSSPLELDGSRKLFLSLLVQRVKLSSMSVVGMYLTNERQLLRVKACIKSNLSHAKRAINSVNSRNLPTDKRILIIKKIFKEYLSGCAFVIGMTGLAFQLTKGSFDENIEAIRTLLCLMSDATSDRGFSELFEKELGCNC